MSAFKLEIAKEIPYQEYLDFRRGKRSGIVVRKSSDVYEDEKESVLYIAELFDSGEKLTIGLGHEIEEVEREVNNFLQTIQNIYKTEKVTDYRK